MKNSNDILLDLISKNASVNEICKIIGLSHKQLFYRMNLLKLKGYDFKKKYYYNGDIVYQMVKDLNTKNSNEVNLITRPNDTQFKAVLISDLHFGNINARPDLLDEVYNYCINKGINILINDGDIIDGPIGCGDIHCKKIVNVEEQIEYLLNIYPFDKNILNFICLGNHDYACLKNKGLDIHKILENKRHDLISLGYGYGKINIKNDQIILTHPSINEVIRESEPNKFMITGHSHRNKNIFAGSGSHIFLPSLSNLSFRADGVEKQLPSMLEITIDFINGFFTTAYIKHFVFVNKSVYKVSESQFGLSSHKNINSSNIENEEIRTPLNKKEYINKENKDKLLEIGYKFNLEKSNNEQNKLNDEKPKFLKLSQIDKFYKRYNMEKK